MFDFYYPKTLAEDLRVARERKLMNTTKPTTKWETQETQEKLSLNSIIDFLTDDLKTEIAGGLGYYRLDVRERINVNGNALYYFDLAPGDRERQDHWHFTIADDDAYDDEDRENSEWVWQDWQESWATPLGEEIEEALKAKFPLLKKNEYIEYTSKLTGDKRRFSTWDVGVNEKGYVEFEFFKAIVVKDL
jgi:hypothetical protein|tara:strand:- start:623 stop:1192 length:570 start_codon:yes stop_codon:yes gene_type:complete